MSVHVAPDKIQKRNGVVVPFDYSKIVSAIYRALVETGEGKDEEAKAVGFLTVSKLAQIQSLITVEQCQDEVERQLIYSGYAATAKAYILYRDKHNKVRKLEVPVELQQKALESKHYFQGNPLGEFVYLRTYSRWLEDKNRRETWVETVDRYIDFMHENLQDRLSAVEYEVIRLAILNQQAMPSMRALQFSGEAARRCNTVFYNCGYISPTCLKDFAEILYLSSRGVGIGFSVEYQNVQQLSQIKRQNGTTWSKYIIEDSAEQWADALYTGLITWFSGHDIEFDFSQIREMGSRLKTLGGRASGPGPLKALLKYVRHKILQKQNRRLSNIDVHDIVCMIGECIVSGGVRRMALISLSDLDDMEMRDAKKGQFYLTEHQRRLANNSAVYERKPTSSELLEEWTALMNSHSGERGIFNRGGLVNQLPERRLGILQEPTLIGANPCCEIILKSKEFCNLSEVIARSGDTLEFLKAKIKIASILGTYQASMTKFNYISDDWRRNCQEEALLGVSISGQWDCEAARDEQTLQQLKELSIQTNQIYAERFGINPAKAVTAIKPSGTVSQTFNCSSGLHPRHSQYYIRRVRISVTDALFKLLRDQGVPYQPEVGQNLDTANTFVLEFPVKSPEGSTFSKDLSAIHQLQYWKKVKVNYTEHNPSATISIGEDEWIGVVDWVYKNWDIIGGLSFLPREDTVYQLAPYEEISKERYEELVASFPIIDYSKLMLYEIEDTTDLRKEAACAGGSCDLV